MARTQIIFVDKTPKEAGQIANAIDQAAAEIKALQYKVEAVHSDLFFNWIGLSKLEFFSNYDPFVDCFYLFCRDLENLANNARSIQVKVKEIITIADPDLDSPQEDSSSAKLTF